MIQIAHRPDSPEVLTSNKVENTRKKIEQKIKNKQSVKSTDFKAHWKEKDVKDLIYYHQNGKCCYCERKRDRSMEMTVEHFRPKSSVQENKDHSGYWWLAYEWDNLFLTCLSCNNKKGDKFPLLDEKRRSKHPGDSLSNEEPYMINPIDENPEDYIGFDWDSTNLLVKAVGLDKNNRGAKVVNELTAINSQSVIEERAQNLETIRTIANLCIWSKLQENKLIFEKIKELIAKYTKNDMQFSGFYRAFFQKNGLGEYISNTKIKDQATEKSLVDGIEQLKEKISKLSLSDSDKNKVVQHIQKLENYVTKPEKTNATIFKATLEVIANLIQGAAGGALFEIIKQLNNMIS